MVEQEIVTALNVPGVTALISNRYYLHIAPEQSISPYCRFFEVSGNGSTDFEGVDGLIRHRWQFDIFGDVTTALGAVREQIIIAMNVYFHVGSYQSRQQPTDQPGEFHYVLDVTFWLK